MTFINVTPETQLDTTGGQVVVGTWLGSASTIQPIIIAVQIGGSVREDTDMGGSEEVCGPCMVTDTDIRRASVADTDT